LEGAAKYFKESGKLISKSSLRKLWDTSNDFHLNLIVESDCNWPKLMEE
jgi:hypothetical protein